MKQNTTNTTKTAKRLNDMLKGMKLKDWELREDSDGRLRLYVRYTKAHPADAER